MLCFCCEGSQCLQHWPAHSLGPLSHAATRPIASNKGTQQYSEKDQHPWVQGLLVKWLFSKKYQVAMERHITRMSKLSEVLLDPWKRWPFTEIRTPRFLKSLPLLHVPPGIIPYRPIPIHSKKDPSISARPTWRSSSVATCGRSDANRVLGPIPRPHRARAVLDRKVCCSCWPPRLPWSCRRRSSVNKGKRGGRRRGDQTWGKKG